MVLSKKEIIKEIGKGTIKIEPFNFENLGTNSYDVTLFNTLAIYDEYILDCKKHNTISYIDIPEEGLILCPGELYLGSTNEYTETMKHLPLLEGKSGLARLGMFIHVTAGFGDVGFKNHWTLEIMAIKPLVIYPNMKIGQIYYQEVKGDLKDDLYCDKKDAKYTEMSPLPKESMYYKNFKK